MICYELTSFGKPLERREKQTPTPTGTEVLVRVSACGVCHSDVHLFDGYFDLGNDRTLDLSMGTSLPLTLGHEIAGEVVAFGPEVPDVVEGCRCVIYPWTGCGTCLSCVEGNEHVCRSPRSLGVKRDGGFADHVLLPHPRYLFDYGSMATEVAATYPCSGLTALSALRKTVTKTNPGNVLILGLGGVGFAALSLVSAMGLTDIAAADVDNVRLDVANGRGVCNTFNPREPRITKRIKRSTEGGFAFVVDFVGSAESASFAMSVLAPGGTLVLVGLFGGVLPVSLPLLPLKRQSIQGSYVGSLSAMNDLMAFVRAGVVPPLPVTSRPLSEVQQALDDLRGGKIVGRLVVHPD